jgi:hypothetical protein
MGMSADERQYTLADLEEAERWASETPGSGNNPNKNRGRIKTARLMVGIIRAQLIKRGIIDIPARQKPQDEIESERIQAELDRLYPNAQSKRIVEYQGQNWIRRYVPLDVSRSGKTVHRWHGYWEKLKPPPN